MVAKLRSYGDMQVVDVVTIKSCECDVNHFCTITLLEAYLLPSSVTKWFCCSSTVFLIVAEVRCTNSK